MQKKMIPPARDRAPGGSLPLRQQARGGHSASSPGRIGVRLLRRLIEHRIKLLDRAEAVGIYRTTAELKRHPLRR